MSRKLGSSQLGSWTFFASPHAVDVCGINGLPLTPNSIHVLGRFQKLKTLAHDHLCCYLDILRGKHERVMIVCEHYTDNIQKKKCKLSSESISRVAFEVLDALSYLHSEGIVHCCLSPGCILLDCENCVKLTNYGLYYMTEGGTTVSFPIGVPKYMAPEILAADPPGRNDYNPAPSSVPSGPKSDVWSLGIIILELALDVELWKDCSLEEVFQTVLLFLKLPSGQSVLNSIARDHDVIQKLQEMPSNLKSFIEAALSVNPIQRPNAEELLKHELFKDYGWGKLSRSKTVPDKFLSTELRCENLEVCKYAPVKDFVAELPLLEVYYLWQLAGGDVEAELRRQGLIKAKPSICTLPNVVIDEGKEFGQKKDRAFLLNDTIVVLPLEQLRQRLKAVDPLIYCPLLEVRVNGLSDMTGRSDLQAASVLPLVIKEKDIEYQLHRIVLFRRLLEAYPYKRPHILKEAKVDIPPLYRPRVWAALLDVKGDIQSYYDAIDKETPTATDRQIEVDIPRCHQYDELLSSPTGHTKFKRLLKAWVVSHPQYVYWQGLDSLCAPFLYLNFNDEALAYSCLSAFIPKYLNNFFLKDNSSVIQEYLAVFSHLIAFHDPELTNHLDSIGFIPELYAIPWFLTMYTHVFPLHKIFHLWDTLLLGSASFPLYVGVAILQQLRANLLSFGFNECILMFSDMPEIDIQRCVQDSIKFYCSTPKSVTFRQHEKPKTKSRWKVDRGDIRQEETLHPELAMSALPLNVLKAELCPRISAEDLLDLLGLLPQDENRSRVQTSKVKILVVDARSHEDFARGSIPDSINIPYHSSFTSEGTLIQSSDLNILMSYKGKMVVVVGSNKNNNASDFSSKLVRLGYPRVCMLHGGIDVLRTTRVLVVRTGDL